METVAFRQNVGEDAHPVFNQTHAVVKQITEAGYATMYIEPAVKIPDGVEVFTGEFEENWLKLNPVEDAVPAWEPVVLKGNAGVYSFTPAAAATESVEIIFSNLGFDNETIIPTIEKDGVTLSFEQGDADFPPRYYKSGFAARVYKSNTMSIYAGGATITKVVFDLTGTPTFDAGSYNTTTKTWEGEATTLTLSNEMATGQVRIKSMVVYYSVAGGGVANVEGNVLKGAAEDIDATGRYILAKPENAEVGFYKANGTIKAGKVYIESESGVKAFYFTGDDATGIANVEKAVENNVIYNLAGQRISKMQKGINIVNGKKVLY